MRVLRETWNTYRYVDRPSIIVWRPARIGVLLALVLTAARWTGHQDYGPALALGAVLVGGFLDTTNAGSYRRRLAALLSGAVLLTLTTLIGGLVSDLPVLHVVFLTLLALICGFATFAGPTATMIGVLAMVIGSIFSGEHEVLPHALDQALAFAVGASASIIVVTVPWLWRRADGSRAALAVVLTGMGLSAPQGWRSMVNVVHAQRLQDADSDLALDDHRDPAATWFHELTREVSQGRFGLMALTDVVDGLTPGPSRTAGTGLVNACAALCRSMARTLRWPATAASVAARRADVEAARQRCVAEAPDLPPRVVATPATALVRAADRLMEPWSIGPKSGVRLPDRPRLTWPAIRPHLNMQDTALRHGIRLAIVMMVAAIISELWHIPHGYWIPMTVGWDSKPSQADTNIRVFSRLTATLVGVALALLIDVAIHPTGWVTIAIISIAASMILVFLASNYALAVTGYSVFIIYLLSTAGDPVTGTSYDRFVCTFVGGLLILCVSILWIVKRSGSICAALVDVIEALRRYRDEVRSMSAGQLERPLFMNAELIGARGRASAAIDSVARAPGKALLAPEDGRIILDGLATVMVHLIIEEINGVSQQSSEDGQDDDLVELADRLRHLEINGHCPPRAIEPGTHLNPSGLERIEQVLDRYT